VIPPTDEELVQQLAGVVLRDVERLAFRPARRRIEPERDLQVLAGAVEVADEEIRAGHLVVPGAFHRIEGERALVAHDGVPVVPLRLEQLRAANARGRAPSGT